MGKRFTPTHEADRRAIEFHLRLREIEQMPNIEVEISDDRKSVIIGDKTRHRDFGEWTVDGVLCLNPKEAIAKGGTYKDLVSTHRKQYRVPSATVQDEVRLFLSGDDD